MNENQWVGATTLIIICFFLSGTAALAYEVLWARMLVLVFGNTTYATGAILFAFMGGLALGSYAFGLVADRAKNLLRLYGVMELGIGLYGLFSERIVNGVLGFYLESFAGQTPALAATPVKFALSVAALIVPTTLMGGTLPVLSSYLIRSEGELESRLGGLYSANTLGGVAGTFLVGFFSIRLLGIGMSANMASAVCAVAGLTAFALGMRRGTAPAGPAPQLEAPPRLPGYRYSLVAFFLSGCAAMIYEVAYTRLLVGIVGGATYSFALILVGFLLGIALGSFIVARVSVRRRLHLAHFSVIEILIGVFGVASIFYFRELPYLMSKGLMAARSSFGGVLLLDFAFVLSVLLVPGTLFGATFPVMAGIYSDGQGHRGRNIGRLYASNTIGAVAGSALGAFVLLPSFGSALAVRLASAVVIAVGLGGLLLLKKGRATAFALASLLVLAIPARLEKHILDSGVAVYGMGEGYTVQTEDRYIFIKEGLNATISVKVDSEGKLYLRTNGKTDANTGEDMTTQLALGYFPALLHGSPKDALVIGLGSGVTVKAVADFSGVESVDIVEIEPAVVEAAGFFRRVNGGAYMGERSRLVVDDARSFIRAARGKYDVIISEPSNPWISGSAPLFSREFFLEARGRLREGGVFCQWVHLYHLNPGDLRMILNTFASVFPETSIWRCGASDVLVMGSDAPAGGFRRAEMQRRLSALPPGEREAYLGISDPLDFLAYFLADDRAVRLMASGAPVNTDDRPLLEFNAPKGLYQYTVSANNALLQEHIPLPAMEGFGGAGEAEAELLYRRSVRYLRMNARSDPAWIDRALALSPGSLPYMLQKAREAKEGTGEEKYEAMISGILERDPGYADANFEMGTALEGRDSEEALKYVLRAVALKGDEFDFRYEAALLSQYLGRYEEDIEQGLKALALPHPVLYDSRVNLMVAYGHFKLERFAEALKYARRAAEADPYDYKACMAESDSYMMLGENARACESFMEALRLVPRSVRPEIEGGVEVYCGNRG